MRLTLNLQTGGSVIFFGTFAASEVCVKILDKYPGSEIAWYLNIRVFGFFERARVETSPLNFLFFPEAVVFAVVAIAFAIAFRIMRFQLGVAFLANATFMASLALASSTRSPTIGISEIVPFQTISRAAGPEVAVFMTLLASSFSAFLASHLAYIRRIGHSAFAAAR